MLTAQPVTKAFEDEPDDGEREGYVPLYNQHWVGLNLDPGYDFAVPRYSPAYWLNWFEHSDVLADVIHKLVVRAVGLGITAAPKASKPVLDSHRNLRTKAEYDVALLEAIIERANLQGEDLTYVASAFLTDYKVCGNAFLELVEDGREAGREIVAIHHHSAAYIQVSKDYLRYKQSLPDISPIFYRSDLDLDPAHKFINKFTGEFYATWPSSLPETSKGTALVHLKTYNPFDRFYGLPVAGSAALALQGSLLVDRRNAAYLLNVPDLSLILFSEGGAMAPESKEHLLALSADGQGVNNSGRFLIVEPPQKGLNAATTKFRLEAVRGRGDDGAFLQYSATNDATIRGLYGLPSTSGGTARTQAASQTIVQDTVHTPDANCVAKVLNSRVASRIGTGQAIFRFERPAYLDSLQKGVLLSRVAPALTLNDLRGFASSLLGEPFAPLESKLGTVPLELVKQFSSILPSLQAAQRAAAPADGRPAVFTPPDAEEAVKGLDAEQLEDMLELVHALIER